MDGLSHHEELGFASVILLDTKGVLARAEFLYLAQDSTLSQKEIRNSALQYVA